MRFFPVKSIGEWTGGPKFTEKFDEAFTGEGIKEKRLPYASPNLNAFAERFVHSIKNEYVGQFVVFGKRHLEFLIRDYEGYYNSVHPHQGIENRTIGMASIPPPGSSLPDPSEVECESGVGELLRHIIAKLPENGTQFLKIAHLVGG
ncbi:MAG: integrase core domain-containing protein [Chthoniobacteraceae bacterium]